jgi:hypothetical protein
MLYLLDPKTGAIRQLTFEQDSDYTPAVLNDGRIVYTRWSTPTCRTTGRAS